MTSLRQNLVRVAWFIAIWTASVLALALVGYAIKLTLGV